MLGLLVDGIIESFDEYEICLSSGIIENCILDTIAFIQSLYEMAPNKLALHSYLNMGRKPYEYFTK